MKRNIKLDIIRIFAFFSVVAVHFFLNTGFYYTIITASKRNFVMVTVKEFFMVCVPLFIILTGYLSTNKKPTVDYYKKLVSKLVLYYIINITFLLFEIYYKHNSFELMDIILYIFGYAKNYNWYFGMYIGLFLLAPYLNIVNNTYCINSYTFSIN